MEENKNRGVNPIIVVLLMIVVLGLAGFICYDKFIKVNNKNEEKEIKETKETSYLDLNELAKAIDMIDKLPALKSLNVEDLKKLNNSQKFYLLRGLSGYNDLSGSMLLQLSKDIFDMDIGFKNQDILCSLDNVASLIYDASTDSYRTNDKHPGHDGCADENHKITIDDSVDKLISYDITGDKLTLTLKRIYNETIGCFGGATVYYSSYDKKDKIYEYEFGLDPDAELSETELLEKNIDKADTVKFTFDIKNGKYIFNNYKVVN